MSNYISASPENMDKYEQPNLVAVDPITGDRYSANSRDYYWHPYDKPLTSPNGHTLVLATTYTQVRPLEAEEDDNE